MMLLNVTMINDQRIFSGISTHFYKIYSNLMRHKISTEFHQFLISEDKPEVHNALIKFGWLHNIDGNSKYFYNAKLALNFLTGTNWRSFKNLSSDIMLLSGPTLLPLTRYNNASIVIGHDLYFLDHFGGSMILNRYMRNKYTHFKDAQLIAVDSFFTKKEFIEKLKIEEDKIEVVYPYIDSKLFYPRTSTIRNTLKISEKDVLLLSVGGDSPNKNIESILKLMHLLPPNFKLIRVGRNFNTLRMISDLNLRDRVVTLGSVSTEFLVELYRGCDIFLFPSLYEGFGIPLVEAMASGIPFITSDRGSLPEVAGDSGIILDPFDLTSMSNSVIQIANDESFKKEIVKKGLKRAECFSAEMQFQSLQRILERVTL